MRPRSSVEHGQYGFARREKCDCEPCQAATRRYVKQRTYDAETGNPRKVDAGPIREHLQALLDDGVSIQQISAATGYKVNKEQIDRVLSGASYRVYRNTAHLLRAVTRESAWKATYAFVDATGVHRRLQALRWLGWSLPSLAEHLPISYEGLHLFTRRERVRSTTVDMIDELYRKLGNTPGPDERERWRAYRAEFVPPAAWDEENIDDPAVKPDWGCVRCIVEECTKSVYRKSLCNAHYRVLSEAGVLEHAQKYKRYVLSLGRRRVVDGERFRVELAELRELGFTAEGAAQRLGRSTKYIKKMWEEVA